MLTSVSTSDHQHHAPDVFGLIWIFDGVSTLVPLRHRVDNQVAVVAVHTGPTAGHHSAMHQNHVPQPGSGPVPKRDLRLEGGQQDVKVFPVEQGHGFFFSWILEGTERVCKYSRPGKSSESIFDECKNYIRIRDAGGLTSHRGRESCK